jgi:hypothetical protein
MATPLEAEAVELTLREVLHWLVDRVSPKPITEVTAHPAAAADVRAAIDKGFGYVPPDEQLSPAETHQLNELQAKAARIAEAQREADAAAAEKAAGVEHTGLPDT